LLYNYRILRHTNPKSGRQATIQAAKDGHNPRPENISGRTLPLFYTQNTLPAAVPFHSNPPTATDTFTSASTPPAG